VSKFNTGSLPLRGILAVNKKYERYTFQYIAGKLLRDHHLINLMYEFVGDTKFKVAAEPARAIGLRHPRFMGSSTLWQLFIKYSKKPEVDK